MVTALAAAIVGVFILQAVEQVWMGTHYLNSWGGLSIEALKQGQVWRLISYAFLHDGLLHMLANVLALVFIGLPLQAEIGQRATAVVMMLMALAGGLCFTLVHATSGGLLLGASAVTVGLLTLFCLNYPNRPVTLLLFFVLPVTILPRSVLWVTLGINLFGFVFGELSPNGLTAVGYSAHLGGMIAAWAVHRWCLRQSWPEPLPRAKPDAPNWVNTPVIFPGKHSPNKARAERPSERNSLQREVDRILDKINTHGFGSLTAQEKNTLDRAKDILGK